MLQGRHGANETMLNSMHANNQVKASCDEMPPQHSHPMQPPNNEMLEWLAKRNTECRLNAATNRPAAAQPNVDAPMAMSMSSQPRCMAGAAQGHCGTGRLIGKVSDLRKYTWWYTMSQHSAPEVSSNCASGVLM